MTKYIVDEEQLIRYISGDGLTCGGNIFSWGQTKTAKACKYIHP